jgi:hypothetical protein
MRTPWITPGIIVLLCAIVPFPAAGQEFSNVGHASANFLKIPVEAVGASIGNSLVASARGVQGLYWNPAALAYTEGTEVIFSRMNWVGDTHISFVGAAHDFGPLAVGLSVTALGMGDMEITTETQPEGTGEMFGAGSYAVGLSFGLRVIDRFSFGGTAKYIHEYIWDTKGSTYAFDFGSVYTTDFLHLRIGMRIANFGGTVTFTGAPIDNKAQELAESGPTYPYDPRIERVAEESPLPRVFNVGISFEPVQLDAQRVTLTAAVSDPNDNATQMGFGGEYVWDETIFVRAGYKVGYDEQNISAGVGVKAGLGGINAQVDFAYAAFGQLGNAGVLSLRVGF